MKHCLNKRKARNDEITQTDDEEEIFEELQEISRFTPDQLPDRAHERRRPYVRNHVDQRRARPFAIELRKKRQQKKRALERAFRKQYQRDYW